MTPIEIGKLYCGLTNNGNFKDISYIYGQKNKCSKNLISPGSCYLTLKDLSNVARANKYSFYTANDNISWKTGTSYGKRDG